MKKFIILMMFSSSVFCTEIDKEKFNLLIEKSLNDVEANPEYRSDSLDVYRFFWLGKCAGLLEAQKILDECEVKN